MAVWSAFWIAITLTNGWPPIYAVAAAASVGLFVLGVGMVWRSRGPRVEPPGKFGNTLHEEVRRNLALVDNQLSLTRHTILLTLGAVLIMVGAGLFSWTLNASQNISDNGFGGWFLFVALFMGVIMVGSRKERDAMRQARPKLEQRERSLRELLDALDAGE